MVKCKFCNTTAKNGAGLSAHMRSAHPDQFTPKKVIPKRPYTKKTNPAPAKLGQDMNYCPNCGCNLRAVKVAITM